MRSDWTNLLVVGGIVFILGVASWQFIGSFLVWALWQIAVYYVILLVVAVALYAVLFLAVGRDG